MAGVEFRPEPVTSRAPSAGGVPLFTEFEPPIVDDADERRALPWPLLLRATRCKQIPGLPWLCSVPAVRPYHSVWPSSASPWILSAWGACRASVTCE
jgi:hypothetical protein